MSGAALSTLGIIAGSGSLPLQLIEACEATGRKFFVIVLDGADIEAFSHHPHATVRIGAVGDILKYLRSADVKDIVMAGGVKRPSLSSLRPDAAGAHLIKRLGKAFFSGDDALLRSVVEFLEDEGFAVIGPDDVLGGLIATEGVLGKVMPDLQAKKDILHGLKIARMIGDMDIGQAVVVENGYVLGMEAAEGTDALIERCGKLKREQNIGVLVKGKKPKQETRADLPSIGPRTIDKLHEAGFRGVAIEAGAGLIIQKDKLLAKADKFGIFVVGVRHE
jgi:UDP-2,3-diacylglucosamine hydrolase